MCIVLACFRKPSYWCIKARHSIQMDLVWWPCRNCDQAVSVQFYCKTLSHGACNSIQFSHVQSMSVPNQKMIEQEWWMTRIMWLHLTTVNGQRGQFGEEGDCSESFSIQPEAGTRVTGLSLQIEAFPLRMRSGCFSLCITWPLSETNRNKQSALYSEVGLPWVRETRQRRYTQSALTRVDRVMLACARPEQITFTSAFLRLVTLTQPYWLDTNVTFYFHSMWVCCVAG